MHSFDYWLQVWLDIGFHLLAPGKAENFVSS